MTLKRRRRGFKTWNCLFTNLERSLYFCLVLRQITVIYVWFENDLWKWMTKYFQIYLLNYFTSLIKNMEKRKEKRKSLAWVWNHFLTGLPSVYVPYCVQKSTLWNIDVVMLRSCLINPLMVLCYLQDETQTLQHTKPLKHLVSPYLPLLLSPNLHAPQYSNISK